MNYQLHYDNLINRAKSRKIDGYVEIHHVVPRCVGGTDEIKNMAALTPEEHLVAHLLLVKTHPGNNKIIYAANMMTMNPHGQRSNNKRFGWFRRLFAIASSNMNTGKKLSLETRTKIGIAQAGKQKSADHNRKNSEAHLGEKNCMFGKKRTEEAKAKTSKSLTGHRHTEETKSKMRFSRSLRDPASYLYGEKNPFYGKRHTEANKAILSAQHTGKHHTEETKAKISAAATGKKPSDETRAKLSSSLKGRVFTPEWKAKISAAKNGKKIGRGKHE